MPIKKTDLYSSLWSSCDALRGGMDAKSLPEVKMPNRDNFFPEFPKLTPQRP